MMAETYEYTSAWTESLKAEGKAEGRAEEKAKDILHILTKRGITVDQDNSEHILNCRDLEQLGVWFDRALDATHSDELFED